MKKAVGHLEVKLDPTSMESDDALTGIVSVLLTFSGAALEIAEDSHANAAAPSTERSAVRSTTSQNAESSRCGGGIDCGGGACA